MARQGSKGQNKQPAATTNDDAQSLNGPKATLRLEDNRPEAAAQRKLRQVMSNSPLVQQATQLQAMADEYTARELPPLQGKGVAAKEPQSDAVVQRTTDKWKTDADVATALAFDYGKRSTWKHVQKKIREYKKLLHLPVASRTKVLNDLEGLINKWKAKRKPTKGPKMVRANNILNVIPQLEALIATERAELVEDQIAEISLRQRVAPVPIPPGLTAGLGAPGMSNQAIAQQVFANINNFRFRYTGIYIAANVAYQTHQGDCGTLMKMFVDICSQYGVIADERMLNQPHLLTPRPINGRTVQGNTHGYTHWYFKNHLWAEVNGTAYDLLFMVSPPPQADLKVADRTHRGVDYLEFASGLCIIKAGEFANLNVDVEGQGRVFNNIIATTAFIDQHI